MVYKHSPPGDEPPEPGGDPIPTTCPMFPVRCPHCGTILDPLLCCPNGCTAQDQDMSRRCSQCGTRDVTYVCGVCASDVCAPCAEFFPDDVACRNCMRPAIAPGQHQNSAPDAIPNPESCNVICISCNEIIDEGEEYCLQCGCEFQRIGHT